MSFGQLSRMSTIKDHNIYKHTDDLYQPLRVALRKSTVSQNHRISQNLPQQFRRSMKSLSPAEAEKSSMFIPIDKPLYPTHNIQKVMGKTFTAVDVKETVGEPISQEEFSRAKTGTVEEIVYQPEDQSRRTYNIYTSRESIPQRQSIFRQESPQRQPIFRQESPQRQSIFRQMIPQQNPIQIRSPQPRTSVRFGSPSPQHEIRQPVVKDMRRPSQLNRPSVNLYTSSPVKQIKEIPIYYNQKSREIIINQSATSLTALQKDASSSRPGDSFVKSDFGSKSYDFRVSTASDKASRSSRPKKDQYKYNLFSVIDEAGNNGCQNGCFHGNQIIAARMDSNPWK